MVGILDMDGQGQTGLEKRKDEKNETVREGRIHTHTYTHTHTHTHRHTHTHIHTHTHHPMYMIPTLPTACSQNTATYSIGSLPLTCFSIILSGYGCMR